jgi:hypothetical protein
MKLYRLPLVVLVVLLLAGCDFVKETAGVIGELKQLQSDLAAKAACKVNVDLNNGRYLNIGLMNSQLKTLPVEQKKVLTHEIARYALARYRGGWKLESIAVSFVTQKSYLIFNYTDSTDNYRYLVADLKEGK